MSEAEFKDSTKMIEELCLNQNNREILRFFSRHPYAKFDKQVLIGGLGLSDNHRIEASLKELTSKSLLETKGGDNPYLYWLTKREPVHSAVKSYLSPKTSKTADAIERTSMMQLIMPLISRPVMAASVR